MIPSSILMLLIFISFAGIAIEAIQKKNEIVFHPIKGKTSQLIGWTLALTICLNVISYPLIYQLFDLQGPKEHIEETDYLLKNYPVFKYFLLVIAAPIGEELFFRRHLFASWSQKYGLFIGWSSTVTIFALLHITTAGIMHALILGSLFTYLFYKTKSIYPAIFSHLFNNGIAQILKSFEGQISFYFFSIESTAEILQFLVAIIIFVIGIIWIEKNYLRNSETTNLV